MKVEINSITVKYDADWGPDGERTEVLVDGEPLGNGYYGGEPEDNMRCRDYSWVEPLLVKLAKRLGAEVVVNKVTSKAEDEEC